MKIEELVDAGTQWYDGGGPVFEDRPTDGPDGYLCNHIFILAFFLSDFVN